MDIDLGKRADGYRARHRKNRIWKKLVSALGCLVVFCTTYALILPAITMERDTLCGLSEHVHTESCYTRQRGTLVCALAQSEGHTHTDACKGTKQVLSCETPETDGHTHGEGCYDAEGNLTCTQPETDGHTHTDGCYRAEEVFVCGMAETGPHQHTDDCYAWENIATCGLEEHTHTDSCYPPKPVETTQTEETPAQTTEPQETAPPTEETIQETTETEAGLMLFAEEAEESLPNVEIKVVSMPKADYDPSKDKFDTTIRIDFRIPGSQFNNETTYTYDYPEGIEIPDNLLNEDHPFQDGRGTYRFEKVGTRYQVRISLPNILTTTDDVTGFVDFKGTLDASMVRDDGSIVIGGGDSQVIIKSNEITYPDGETEKYDISASKSTDGVIKDGKLTYTVTVSSRKGTPSPISLTDTITANGLKLGAPTVTVKGQEHRATWNWNADTGTGTITMNDLPGLGENESYNIVYTYDVTDYPSAMMNPANKLTVKAKDENRHQEVTDEKTVTTSIDKRHTATKNGQLEDGRIKWTITVNANGTDIAGATLTDEMLKALASGTNISVTPANGYVYADGKITFNPVNGEKNNQTYTITYYTDVPEDDSQKTVKNEATFDPDPEEPGDEIKTEKTVGVGIDAAKFGSYDKSAGTITWKIIINSKQRDIAEAVLTDDMLSQALPNTIQVTPNEGYEQKMENGKVSIIFLAGEDGKNTNTYTITYQTKANPAMIAKTVSNTAHLVKGDIEEEVTARVKIDSDGSVSKSSGKLTLSEDGTTGTLPWTVTIHVPAGGMPQGTELVDWMGDQNRDDVYMTADQVRKAVQAFQTALGFQPSDMEVNLSNYVYRPPDRPDYYDNLDSYPGVKFRRITIKLLKGWLPTTGDAQDVTVTYDTTLTIDPAKQNYTYYNTFKAGERQGNASYEYWKSGVEKTDGNGESGTSTVTSQGELVWKVTVYLDETQRKSLDITDSLPTGVKLTKLQLFHPQQWGGYWFHDMAIGEDGNISGNAGNRASYQVTGNYDSNTNQVTLKVTDKDGVDLPTKTRVGFIFTCEVDCTDGEPHDFTNNVTVAGIGSATQTQEWTYDNPDKTEVLSKTGKWLNNSRMLSYTVDINPDGKMLGEDGIETLTLVDALTHPKVIWAYTHAEDGSWPGANYQMDVSLIQSSVKLYQVTRNEDGTQTETQLHVPWVLEETQDNSNRVCTLRMSNVPNGFHLRLEYMYQVETAAPEGYIIDRLGVSNKVALEGTGYEKKSDSFPSKWKDAGTTGQVTSGKTLAIYKVAKGDYGTVLPGAQFTVYTVDTSVNPYQYTKYAYQREDGTQFANPITSNEYGLLTIRIRDKEDAPENFAYNTLYAIWETKAPAGYRLPDDPPVLYFYFSNEEDTEHVLPTNLPSGALNLSQTDQQKFVENEPAPVYELPQTGGSGTRGFTLGGAALTAAGLHLLTRKKRRRRDARAQ